MRAPKPTNIVDARRMLRDREGDVVKGLPVDPTWGASR